MYLYKNYKDTMLFYQR